MSRQTIYPNHTEVFPNGTIITLPPDHYGYAPTEWVCALFVALYALSACMWSPIPLNYGPRNWSSTGIHLGQAVRYRMWWLIPTAVLAGLGEVLGWSGRLWSSRNLPLNTPFLIQWAIRRPFVVATLDRYSSEFPAPLFRPRPCLQQILSFWVSSSTHLVTITAVYRQGGVCTSVEPPACRCLVP